MFEIASRPTFLRRAALAAALVILLGKFPARAQAPTPPPTEVASAPLAGAAATPTQQQVSGAAAPPASGQAGAPASPPTADEIAALKKRIEVLEADKKAAADAAKAGGQDVVPWAQTKAAPFSDSDWSWMMSNSRTVDFPLTTKYFTPEIRVDANYNLDFNHPADDTISGSSEIFRSQEFQIEQLGVGGDFNIGNAHARFMTQYGLYSETTARNDASPGRGGWDLDGAYRYLSEAYGGYHWDKLHGINIDAGIFMSYIGLFSYYNFDNWAYQPSFVSSNTPWFFNGIRGQIFPTAHLKIEPWFVNGWQSYGRFNSKPGLGGQIKYARWNLDVISNNYGYGEDSAGNPDRARIHTDNSVQYKYYEKKYALVDRMAFTVTADLGCEFGAYSPTGATGGVSCHKNTYHTVGKQIIENPKQSFVGWMAYDRTWFHHDRYGLTIGGGQVNNPGRYLVLEPIINEATALSGSSYFTENPGDPYKGMDGTITWDYMPSQFVTFRTEYGYRHANVPYWTGRKGMTPPGATTQASVGSAADYTCTNGTTSVDAGIAYAYNPGTDSAANYAQAHAANLANAKAWCGGTAAGSPFAGQGLSLWQPDLRKDEQKITFALMVKF